MKHQLDWRQYQDQGMGDAYADIPRHGGDFAKAVSVCIRSGVCEQPSRGVMCPSFRLSNDAKLSPAGRVKLLKQALNDDDTDRWLKDPLLAEVMEACVACKACKRECENNLDMAQIKVEYLAQLRQKMGGNMRSWLFAYWPMLLSRFPLLRYLLTGHNRFPWVAYCSETLFGIAAKVALPEVAAKPFSLQQSHFSPPYDKANHSAVALWVEPFSSLFKPEHLEAALSLLLKAGYEVHLVQADKALDSGRTLLSQGYVAEAKQAARRVIDAMLPHVAAGRRIIGLEPSALLMLRDEYLHFGLGEKAQAVAQAALMLEEFIARETKQGRFNLHFSRASSTKLLVHGHCHQKAVGAMKSLRRVLKMVQGLDFEFIEASCCGMAGTFGLEAEHAEESAQMAELALLPALAQEPTAQVLCNGFSCSLQIANLAKRESFHLANILLDSLIENDAH